MKNKIAWSLLLCAFVFAVFIFISKVKPRDKSKDNVVQSQAEKYVKANINSGDKASYYKRILNNDGVLYSKFDEELKSDIIVKTEYYDTTINDMYMNFESYDNKNIEIEGMYLNSAKGYTFVGRYSSVSTCAYCSGGLSYIEYEFNGNIQEKLEDQKTWLKLVGKWKRKMMNFGTEEEPYYDLDVLNFEIMNTRGEDTVKN